MEIKIRKPDKKLPVEKLDVSRGADGKLYRPDGVEVVPNIPVGPEEHHLRLFVEYEYTFGRGRAKDLTHDREQWDRQEITAKYGEGFGEEYEALAREYGNCDCSLEQAEELMRKLREYRQRHSGLYQD